MGVGYLNYCVLDILFHCELRIPGFHPKKIREFEWTYVRLQEVPVHGRQHFITNGM